MCGNLTLFTSGSLISVIIGIIIKIVIASKMIPYLLWLLWHASATLWNVGQGHRSIIINIWEKKSIKLRFPICFWGVYKLALWLFFFLSWLFIFWVFIMILRVVLRPCYPWAVSNLWIKLNSEIEHYCKLYLLQCCV